MQYILIYLLNIIINWVNYLDMRSTVRVYSLTQGLFVNRLMNMFSKNYDWFRCKIYKKSLVGWTWFI